MRDVMAVRADDRTLPSLLRPGMEIEPGEGYCCACIWHVSNEPDVELHARAHGRRTRHPVVWKLPRAANHAGS